MIKLRDYQQDFIDAFFKASDAGVRSMLGVLPTGTGKTIVFAEIARIIDAPTLILAHRDELIQQAVAKLREVWPDVSVGVVKGPRHEIDRQVTVASVQSLHKKRLETLPKYKFIVTDEAHHASAPQYRRIYHRFGLLDESPDKTKRLPQLFCPGINHLGVTATPKRTDKKGLKPIFEKIVYQGNYPDFVPQYLADLRVRGVHTNLDLSNVRTSRLTNDFNEAELNKQINTDKIASDILRAYCEFGEDRTRTLVFCVSREHAFKLTQFFQTCSIPSGYLDCNTPHNERKQILEEFRNGEIRCLFNCLVLTEGFDLPEIDCILIARPTRSSLLLTQMIGRGTRRARGKTDCMVIDVALHQREAGVVNTASLFRLDPVKLEDDKPVTKAIAEQQGLRSKQTWGYSNDTEAVDYSLQMSFETILEIYKTFEHEVDWHSLPATEKQMALINRDLNTAGLKSLDDLTRGQAAAIIDAIFAATPATEKQRSYMRHLGIEFDPKSITKTDASALISKAVAEREGEAECA